MLFEKHIGPIVRSAKKRPVEFTLIGALVLCGSELALGPDILTNWVRFVVLLLLPSSFILNHIRSDRQLKKYRDPFTFLYYFCLPLGAITIALSITYAVEAPLNRMFYSIVFCLIVIDCLVGKRGNDGQLTINLLHITSSVLFSIFITGVVFGVVALIMVGLERAFNLRLDYSLALSTIACLFIPVVILAFYDNRPHVVVIESPSGNFLVNNILIPLFIILTAGCYALIVWQIVGEGLAFSIFAPIAVAYFTLMISVSEIYRLVTKRTFTRFIKFSPLLGLPALVYYCYSLALRIYEQGFTDLRIYLICIGLVVGIWALFRWLRPSDAVKATLVFDMILALITGATL